jgi:hypothetical protein
MLLLISGLGTLLVTSKVKGVQNSLKDIKNLPIVLAGLAKCID